MMVQKVNVTLDNVSPLINYSPPGTWREGSSADSLWQSYDHNGTFTLTTTFGASASLTFNGTTVWIFGAKRDNHGMFNTTIDNKTYTNDDGYSSVNIFRQVLVAGVDILPNGTFHTVSIANSFKDPDRPYLDIDSIVYEVEIPDGHQQVIQQDNVDAFQWSSDAWNNNPTNLSSYNGSTGHTASTADAYVVYTFEVGYHYTHAPHNVPFSDNQTGSHVEIYGAVGPSSGAYTVQVDNGASVTLNGTKANFNPQTLLYQDNSLAPGTHTVKISNTPFAGQTLSIDYALIYSNSTTSDDSGSSSSLSPGDIGGIVIGGFAGLLLILCCVFLWYRRRNRLGPTSTENPLTPTDQGTGPVTFHMPTLPATIEQYQPLTVSPPPSAGLLRPPLVTTPIPSPSHSNSSGSNSDSRSRLILHNPNPSFSGNLGSAQENVPASENRGPYQAPDYVTRQQPQTEQSNSRLLALPSLSEQNLRTTRLQVEGRPQDFGPITFVPDPEPEGHLLPPDYYQATQPFPSR